jgi:hypothetical protein
MRQIKRRSFLGSSAALVGGGLITDNAAQGQNHGPDHSEESPGAVRHHASALSLMTETANRFLAALSP